MSHSLRLSKQVKGNQASFRQYFRFTVRMTGHAAEGDGDTRIAVTGAYDARPAENMATSYDADVMCQANDTDLTVEGSRCYITLSRLREGKDFYLHSGQSVILSGIPDGVGYEITEAQEDYSPSVTVTGDAATASDNQVADDSLHGDAAAEFLNERRALIPSTGISAELALPAIVMLACLIAMLVIRWKRR